MADQIDDQEMQGPMIDMVDHRSDFLMELCSPQGAEIIEDLKQRDKVPNWNDPRPMIFRHLWLPFSWQRSFPFAGALFIVCIHQRCRRSPSTRSSAARERGLQRRRRVLQLRRRRGLVRLTKRAGRLRDPRLHVLCESWSADQQNAGPRALRIPAFEPDRADAGFVRFDGGKPH